MSSGSSIYGFVVFGVLLLIGIVMLSNVLSGSGVDLNSNGTNSNSTTEGGLSDSVRNVAHGIEGGYSFAVIGIGVLAAAGILKVLGYI